MNIDRIRANVVGDYGLSSSNKYQVGFMLPSPKRTQGSLLQYLFKRGVSNVGTTNPAEFERNDTQVTTGTILSYLADEVNIPGFSIATGEFKGFRPGINARYPHTRNPNECSIAFMQDMNHTPLSFIRAWVDYMFGFDITDDLDNGGNRQPYGLMNYYDDYVCDIIIDKLEPNTNTSTKLQAKSSYETHNVVTRTILHNAYPYLSNDFTVSNGPNQPVRVGVTFFYEYMTTRNPVQYNTKPDFGRTFRRGSVNLSNDQIRNRVAEPGVSPARSRLLRRGSSFIRF